MARIWLHRKRDWLPGHKSPTPLPQPGVHSQISPGWARISTIGDTQCKDPTFFQSSALVVIYLRAESLGRWNPISPIHNSNSTKGTCLIECAHGEKTVSLGFGSIDAKRFNISICSFSDTLFHRFTPPFPIPSATMIDGLDLLLRRSDHDHPHSASMECLKDNISLGRPVRAGNLHLTFLSLRRSDARQLLLP